MNKRAVILLGIFALLVLVTLNRWDIRFYYEKGCSQIRFDKLTYQTQILGPAKNDTGTKRYFKPWLEGNQYLIHGMTVLLYSSIAATTIALLKEARRKE